MSSDPTRATPPDETPGPSVPAAGSPRAGSTTEQHEFAEERAKQRDLVAEEEAAAAEEARGIGGRVDPEKGAQGDPAMAPVYEAGGGEAEGFEAAEDQLIENASHGDGRGDPERDAFRPEVESDRSTAVHGEADDEHQPDA